MIRSVNNETKLLIKNNENENRYEQKYKYYFKLIEKHWTGYNLKSVNRITMTKRKQLRLLIVQYMPHDNKRTTVRCKN